MMQFNPTALNLSKKKHIAYLVLSILLAGCAGHYQVPVPNDHPKETQLQMQAVRHWDILAEDIAKESMNELRTRKLESQNLTVVWPRHKSEFTAAMHQLLSTHLFNQGAVIKQVPDFKLRLEYNVQVVQFKSDRTNRRARSRYFPGMFTSIATGIVVLRNINDWHEDAYDIAAIASGVGADIATQSTVDSYREIPKTEILVNTAIVKDGTYLMRRADIYYVNDPDATLYDSSKAGGDMTLMDRLREHDREINTNRKHRYFSD